MDSTSRICFEIDEPREIFAYGRFECDASVSYAVTVERITGKETAPPTLPERWPALDRTKSPNAKPPAS